MFPMIDKATGNFLLGSRMTYGGEALGKRLNEIGVSLGFQKGVIGAWSLRKDACEVQATCGSADATFLAARVLGHRKVNSRTMDRVYRADLRLRDLGQHWRGAEKPAELLCPTYLSFVTSGQLFRSTPPHPDPSHGVNVDGNTIRVRIGITYVAHEADYGPGGTSLLWPVHEHQYMGL